MKVIGLIIVLASTTLLAMSEIEEKFWKVCCTNRTDQTVEFILQNYPDLNVNVRGGDFGDIPLQCLCSRNKKELITLLLDHKKFNINAQNKWGRSGLHTACLSYDSETITLLLQHKDVNSNIQDESGNTPLHDACKCDRVDVVYALLEHGVDITLKNKSNKTALERANNSSLQKILTVCGKLLTCHSAAQALFYSLCPQFNKEILQRYEIGNFDACNLVQENQKTVIKWLVQNSYVQKNICPAMRTMMTIYAIYLQYKNTETVGSSTDFVAVLKEIGYEEDKQLLIINEIVRLHNLDKFTYNYDLKITYRN